MSLRTHQHELDPATTSQAVLIAQRRRMEEELASAESRLRERLRSALLWHLPLLIVGSFLLIAGMAKMSAVSLGLILIWPVLDGVVLRRGSAALVHDWRDVRQRRQELRAWDQVIQDVSAAGFVPPGEALNKAE